MCYNYAKMPYIFAHFYFCFLTLCKKLYYKKYKCRKMSKKIPQEFTSSADFLSGTVETMQYSNTSQFSKIYYLKIPCLNRNDFTLWESVHFKRKNHSDSPSLVKYIFKAVPQESCLNSSNQTKQKTDIDIVCLSVSHFFFKLL